MTLRRALLVAACMLPLAAASAYAQFPPAPGQEPPCMTDFVKLRNDTENKAKLIQEASKRPAQAKMLKFATANATWCGIPPQVIDQIKTGTAHAAEIRAKLCKMAEAPPRPAGPSLSDALTAPVPNASNIRSGGGTFDTL